MVQARHDVNNMRMAMAKTEFDFTKSQPAGALAVAEASTYSAMAAESKGHMSLEIRDLSVIFPTYGRKPVWAVAGVSLAVASGEIVGLVGESGSGKTTLARAIMAM